VPEISEFKNKLAKILTARHKSKVKKGETIEEEKTFLEPA
jgi:hypothetical protein